MDLDFLGFVQRPVSAVLVAVLVVTVIVVPILRAVRGRQAARVTREVGNV